MTAPVLRATPAGLRELAQRCEALAAQVAPPLSPVTASAWQASGAAAGTVNAGGGKTATALQGRMSASAKKLGKAALDYAVMDDEGAAALTRVGFTPLVPRSGGDGGAGGRGVTPAAPPAVHTGADGGAAGGFGTPR